MMKQVQRVILIVRLRQTQVVHLDLVLQQVDKVQKGALKVAEVWGDQEGRKRKRLVVIVTGTVVVALTVTTRNLTKS